MMHSNTESFAKRIKTALTTRNIKQTELCKITNIPKSVMSEYLKGSYEPKQDRLMLIAEALDVDPVWLMGYNVPMAKFGASTTDDVVNRAVSESMFTAIQNSFYDDNLRTEVEKMMILLFRQLSPDQQQVMLATIRAFVESCVPKEYCEES